MKVAQYRTGANGHTMVASQFTGESCEKYSDWVRLTEYAEVEFVQLPAETVVKGQLDQIDAAEAQLRTKFQEKLNELAEARAKLLSLTHEVTA